MKKPLAILLAFFIVFAPVYSNAVLPALAASAASATRVLVANTIKKVSPAALANARKAAVGICAKNPRLCGGAGMGALGLALTSDGWNIEITNTDVNNIDVDIYKLQESPDTCQDVWYYDHPKYKTNYKSTPDAVCYSVHEDDVVPPSYYPNFNIEKFDKVTVRTIDSIGVKYCSFEYTTLYNLGGYAQIFYPQKTCVVAPNPSNKTYITNYELNQYVTNNTTNNDIDIKDIYNFDFSQYNINIGGDTYNGTTINNDLSKSDPSEADKKVSPDLKKKLDDKTISLDDVNDQNCTKNEAGEYDKCGDKTDPTDPTDPEEPTDPEPEPPPIECDANGFYKKVCDWMDWTQKPHDKPDSGNVDIIDKSEGLNIDQNRIDFTNQCPAPTPINTSVGGFPVSTELNYQPLCDFFTMLNPFVIGMGGISSALIIAASGRRL